VLTNICRKAFKLENSIFDAHYFLPFFFAFAAVRALLLPLAGCVAAFVTIG
jgi:hypothetical protein